MQARVRQPRRIAIALLGALVLAGCVTPAFPGATPPSGGPAAATAATVMGRVTGPDGRPAAGVRVRAFPAGAAPEGASMVAAGAGNLIGNDAGSLIGNDEGSLLGNDAGSLRDDEGLRDVWGLRGPRRALLAAEATTDADGRFALPVTGPANVEAVQSDRMKAIALGTTGAAALELKLAPTGTITGRVAAADAAVTNLEGVDVFVPGTSYLAKADAQGAFTLTNVAAGAFTLVASKPGLGRASVAGVAVAPDGTAAAGPLVLRAALPRIASLSAAVGAPGSTLVITGENFGATEGTPFQVTVGGAVATAPRRLDDATIALTVPDAAASGDVVVAVGGVPGEPRPFQVVKTLGLEGNGAVVPLGAPRPLVVTAADAAGKAVAAPPVAWSVEGDAARLDAAAGALVPLAEGTVTLRATLGNLVATHTLRVAKRAAMVTTVAKSVEGGVLTGAYSLAVGPDGTAWVQSDAERIQRVAPDGKVTSLVGYGQLGDFWALAREADGTLYVADPDRDRIAKVAPGGEVTTLAGVPGEEDLVDGPAADARFTYPAGLALADRKLYVTDLQTVREIDLAAPGQPVRTIVGAPTSSFMLKDPTTLAVGGRTLYVADQHRIYAVDLDRPGTAPTVLAGAPTSGYADGEGVVARFNVVAGMAVRGEKLYVADLNNHRIRVVDLADPAHRVTTLAGTGEPGDADGDGPQAGFHEPAALGFDAAGRLYVTDFMNHALRRIELVGED